jgi:oxalate decarboxylase/phosphoglucose isomerase-like protein (cupin superfamily)
MLALAEIAGLPVSLADDGEVLQFNLQEVCCNTAKRVKLLDISPSLLNKSLRYPEVVYMHHSRVLLRADESSWPDVYSYDIITIPAGLLGIEYIKTHIFYDAGAEGKAACVVHVFSGTLTIMLQKNKPKLDRFDIETHVEEAMLIMLKQGQKAAIPAGYYYTFVNTTESPVVFARIVANEHTIDYTLLKRENGLAYYLISKNARLELVNNPRYRTLAKVKKVNAAELNTRCSYSPDDQSPLYAEAKLKPQVFKEMLA